MIVGTKPEAKSKEKHGAWDPEPELTHLSNIFTKGQKSRGPLDKTSRIPREFADYVFCQHTKNNIMNYENQRCISILIFLARPFAHHFFVLPLFIGF
jgi:hypothetical protein